MSNSFSSMESLQISISKIEIPQKLRFDSKSWTCFKIHSNALITLYNYWIYDFFIMFKFTLESMKYPHSHFMTLWCWWIEEIRTLWDYSCIHWVCWIMLLSIFNDIVIWFNDILIEHDLWSFLGKVWQLCINYEI